MRKTNKFYFLWVLMVFGLTGLVMGNAMAENMPGMPDMSNKTVQKDILSDDNAENNLGDSSDSDAANDYDSNKESDSENAAPTPPEEEDNPVLDEEGNVSVPGQSNSMSQPKQTMKQNTP